MAGAWRVSTLGDLADIIIGRTPPRGDTRFWTSELTRPFCTIADMTGNVIDPAREGVTDVAEAEGKAKRVPAGALLMSFKLTIGRVGFAARDLFPNEAIAWLRPRVADVSDAYLALFLSAQDLSVGSGRAVKGNTLNGPSLRAIPVRYPSPPEQRRIVDLVSALDRNVAALADERAVTQSLRATLIDDQLSRCNETTTLGALAEVVQGKALPKAHQGLRTGPISWFKIADMTGMGNEFGYTLADTRMTEAEVARLNGRVLPAGSVVFPRVGAAVLTEKKRLLEVDAAVDENHLVLIPDSSTHSEYLLGLMEWFRLSYLVQTGAVPSLNMGLIRNAEVPLATDRQQQVLGEVLGGLRELARSLDVESQRCRDFRTALLEALLTAEVEIPKSYDALLAEAV